MKHSHKPALLLLTSSFPSTPEDDISGYVRDFARSLSVDFDITVLAPPDRAAVLWPADVFSLTRSRSIWPLALDPFNAGADLNDLASGSLLAELAALVSMLCFFGRALRLALTADAICSHWLVPGGLVGALISRALGKPHIVVEHSGALHLLTRMRGGRRLARFIVEASDRIVTVSADLKHKLIELSPQAEDRVSVIPMGVSVCSPSGVVSARSQTRTILFIGRLTEIKGLDVLLRAMEGMGDCRLVIAGDGHSGDELKRLARSLSVDARFVGRIGATERRRLLSTCDAVVIPSRVLADGRTEGSPVVCLEAMAAGRAVIASRVGGLAEIIDDGENGLLFEQGDHRMLNEKLSLVLGDDRLRLELADNAQRFAASFEWSRIGSRYSRIIQTVVNENDAIGNKAVQPSGIDG